MNLVVEDPAEVILDQGRELVRELVRRLLAGLHRGHHLSTGSLERGKVQKQVAYFLDSAP